MIWSITHMGGVIVDLNALNQFWEMFDYCDAIPSEVQGWTLENGKVSSYESSWTCNRNFGYT